MHGAIRQNETICAEVVVVRFIAEISSVGPELFPVSSLFADALVVPVPNKAAMRPRLRIDNVPILLEVPGTVPHGVRVLNLEERASLAVCVVVRHGVLGLRIHG